MCQAMHLRSPAGIQAWGGTRLRRLDGFTQFLEPVLDGGIKQHLSATRIRVIAKFGRALPELLPAPAVWIIPTCAPSGGLRRIPASTAYLAQRSWGYLWRGVRGAAPSTRVRNTGRTHAPCGCDCAEAAPERYAMRRHALAHGSGVARGDRSAFSQAKCRVTVGMTSIIVSRPPVAMPLKKTKKRIKKKTRKDERLRM